VVFDSIWMAGNLLVSQEHRAAEMDLRCLPHSHHCTNWGGNRGKMGEDVLNENCTLAAAALCDPRFRSSGRVLVRSGYHQAIV
jgi:hypothetical protein